MPGALSDVPAKQPAESDPELYGSWASDEGAVPTIVLNKDFSYVVDYLRGPSLQFREETAARRRENYALGVATAIGLAAEEQKKNGLTMDDEHLGILAAAAARGVLAVLAGSDEALEAAGVDSRIS